MQALSPTNQMPTASRSRCGPRRPPRDDYSRFPDRRTSANPQGIARRGAEIDHATVIATTKQRAREADRSLSLGRNRDAERADEFI